MVPYRVTLYSILHNKLGLQQTVPFCERELVRLVFVQ